MGWNDDGSFETEDWPYREARHHGPRRSGNPRLIVIHSAETGEGEDTAVALQNYAATTDRKASWHVAVDGGLHAPHVTQSVFDSYVAYAAPGANHDGLQIEQAGRAAQRRAEWLDDYGRRLIDRTGDVVAQWAIKYDIPIRQLTDAELARGDAGLIGHVQASRVYKRSSHTDPGNGYPWDVLLERARAHYRKWMSQRPGFQPADDKPDFKVAVVVNDDISAGMGRVHARFNQLMFLRWPHEGVTVGTAVLIGGSPSWRDKIAADYGATHTIAGANREVTARLVAAELTSGFRSADLDY